MKLNLVRSNANQKGITVFVNGVLMSEDEYDWDSIKELPIFKPKANVRNKNLITVITFNSIFEHSRKEYEVEEASGAYIPNGGDLTLGDSDCGVTFYDDDVDITSGYVQIATKKAPGFDGYGDLHIPAGNGLHYKTQEGNGGDVTITAGEGQGGGESGKIIIRSNNSIHLDAPKIIVGQQEDEWQTLSTSKSD